MEAGQGVVTNLHRKAPKLTNADFQTHEPPEYPISTSHCKQKLCMHIPYIYETKQIKYIT